MRSVLLRAVLAACIVALIAGPTHARESGDELTLAEAVGKAARQHPSLRAFEFNLQFSESRATEASLRPLPQLELGMEDFAGTGVRRGLHGAETTLALGQVIELGGKTNARRAVADASTSIVRTRHSAQQLDVVAEVARRFYVVLEGQVHAEIAGEGVRLAEEAMRLVEQRVKAARSPPAEAARAAVQVAEARLAQEDIEHELAAARHRLAAAMGQTVVDFGPAQGDLLVLAQLAPFEQLLGRLKAAPDVLQFADEARLRDAELRLVELQRRPDLRATLGVRRHEQGDDVALVAGVTVPLFSGRLTQPREKAARAARNLVDTARETHWLEVQSQLFSQYLELEHARHLTSTLQDELIPALETALKETAYAYERGRYSYLEWSVARQDLLAARMRLVQAALRYHLLRTEIERLTGENIDDSGAQP